MLPLRILTVSDYLCIYICMCVYIYIILSIHICVHMCIYILSIHISMYMCIYKYIYNYLYIYMYMCVYPPPCPEGTTWSGHKVIPRTLPGGMLFRAEHLPFPGIVANRRESSRIAADRRMTFFSSFLMLSPQSRGILAILDP